MINATNSPKYQFTYKNFSAVLDKYQYNFHVGDIVAGTIFSVESKSVLVDIGAKVVGFLPLEEAALNKVEDISDILKLNKIREFYILTCEKNSQQIILSIKKVEFIRSWQRIKQIYTENVILETQIIKFNRGGIIVQLDGLKGFVPMSHVINFSKQQLKKSSLPVKILKADEGLNYLLCSSRCAYIQRHMNVFALGKEVSGTVQSIKSYGVLVYVDQVQGLLHVSEINQTQNKPLDQMFYIGQKINVVIVHVDMQKGRINLSQKGIS